MHSNFVGNIYLIYLHKLDTVAIKWMTLMLFYSKSVGELNGNLLDFNKRQLQCRSKTGIDNPAIMRIRKRLTRQDYINVIHEYVRRKEHFVGRKWKWKEAGRPTRRWLDSTTDGIEEKRLSGEEVHDRATHIVKHRPTIKVRIR